MKEPVPFYHEVEETESSNICISFYEKRGSQNSYARAYIIISRHSIPELIALLKNPEFIPQRKEGSFKNSYDFIQIYYGGSDGSPSLGIGNDRSIITGNTKNDREVYIPIDLSQRKDYQYLDPLIEDLKRYIIE